MKMGADQTEYATRYDLNTVDARLSDEIKQARDYIDVHSREIAKLEAVYQNLERLPDTIANLDKTITVISNNLGSMNQNLNDVRKSVETQEQAIQDIKGENKNQNENIERIDNKSKIDWAVFLTNSFWKILCIGGVLYAIIKAILERSV